jgi:hypothetical protein
MGNSKAYSQTLDSLMRDVQNLVTLHPASEGTPGRPQGDTGPLLRSTVVLLHTAWENYVEQVALEGLDFLLTEIDQDHSKLSHPMRTKLAKVKNPWSLAGALWQSEARQVLSREAEKLNTPSVANVEALLKLAFGLSDGLHGNSWQGIRSGKVVLDIDSFVQEIRGEIVHKGTTPGALNKSGVNVWIAFFDKLTSRLDDKIAAHLLASTGTSPW